MAKRVVLAYSGGLDTSVAVRWMIEEMGVEVITLAADVGQGGDFETIKQRALAAGAVEALVVDCTEEYAYDFVAPALKANARYEGKYPLISALSRPIIAKHLVAAARQPRRRRHRPRLHRQRQRPGPLRRVDPGVGARSRGHRPGPGLGPHPRAVASSTPRPGGSRSR